MFQHRDKVHVHLSLILRITRNVAAYQVELFKQQAELKTEQVELKAGAEAELLYVHSQFKH